MSSATLQRLHENCSRGEFYEALQQYKVHLARLVNTNKRDAAVDFLTTGVQEMLSHGQVTMATELASLLKDAFTKMSVPYDARAVGDMVRLMSLFPPSSEAALQRCEILRGLHAWKHSDKTVVVSGTEDEEFLNRQLGECQMELKDYHSARRYLINTSDVEKLQKCVRIVASGSEYDAPYYWAHVALQLLCMTKLKVSMAKVFLQGVGMPSSPILNCATCVIVALEAGDAKVFHAVKAVYQGVLARDPVLGKMMGRIEQVHFGTGGGGGGGGGDFLTSMFSMMAKK